MTLDEQIKKVAEVVNSCMVWAQDACPEHVNRMLHRAGEWLAVENSLRELRSRQAGEWVDD